MKNQVKTINHLGQVVYQESVEFYKEKLSVYSKDFLHNLLIPQLYEWSNAYKTAVELTK
ncbi:putative transcriptional regulator [Lactococcus lactis]|uniref:putative transcriptional regulator n=1 Tax=Lactococcus lactis TaxID=1358 RepID=UPI0032E4409B